jgi:hypothetical protein
MHFHYENNHDSNRDSDISFIFLCSHPHMSQNCIPKLYHYELPVHTCRLTLFFVAQHIKKLTEKKWNANLRNPTDISFLLSRTLFHWLPLRKLPTGFKCQALLKDTLFFFFLFPWQHGEWQKAEGTKYTFEQRTELTRGCLHVSMLMYKSARNSISASTVA